ncbi:FAD-binding protein, partial [candidate division GN15 bacterium]|nr:FAD-binding protein [candidate division GN15 bacterium]
MRTLIEAFGTNLEFGRNMAPLTSYQTGGRARYFVSAESTDEVVRAIKAAKRLDMEYFVMGSGSNLLVSDEGYDGVVIKVDVKGLSSPQENRIQSGAGEELMDLVRYASYLELTGIEFAAGIWGTVGGAIYGNAGAFGGEIKDVLTGLTVVDNDGGIKEVGPDYCAFTYRHSRLKETRETVTWATFELQPGEGEVIRARVEEILAQREQKHPSGACSAGCLFKNIPDESQPHGKLPS